MITVIANLKGGSGKSTVAFNLGVWLLKKGHPVAAYDLDPQMTLSDVATVRREEGYSPPLQVYLAQESLAEHLKYHPGEVIVDVGVANMPRMKEAIGVADRVIIPVPPSQPDVWATQRFLKMIKDAVSGENHPEILAFINRADTHHAVRESDEAEEAIKTLSGVTLYPHRLFQRTIYRRSLSEGLSVFELWPNCKAAREINTFASGLYPEIANAVPGR
ncbi:MAG TPA: ParA family protein [Gammaproteobacteria bacterium]|nr:ParA family protein [Gammaproteobacteria bacterium]